MTPQCDVQTDVTVTFRCFFMFLLDVDEQEENVTLTRIKVSAAILQTDTICLQTGSETSFSEKQRSSLLGTKASEALRGGPSPS